MTTSQSPLLPKRFNRESDNQNAHELWVRIASFLAGRSTLTRVTYGGILREWCRFLGAEFGTPEGAQKFVSATDLHASSYRLWLERQRGQKSRLSRRGVSEHRKDIERRTTSKPKLDGSQDTLSNATIAKKLSALRRMYKALINSGNLATSRNPFDVDMVRPPSARSGMKRPTEMVTFDLVEEILSLPDRTHPKGIRDAAILATLFGAGLRRGEVVKITLGDIKRSLAGTPYVRLRSTKSRKDVDHALPDWVARQINDLVIVRKSEGARDGDPLFVGYRGQAGLSASRSAMSSSGLYRLFKSYCSRVTDAASLSPHSARATAITKLLSDGLSHREVQEFSRHSSIQMVETYDKRRLSVDEGPGKTLSYSKKKRR